MSEENNQSQDLEQNNQHQKPEDKQDWKKGIAVTIAVVLLVILFLYGMVSSINSKKQKREAAENNTFSQQLMEAAKGLETPEASGSYHSKTVEVSDDDLHSMRIEDYEMKYKYKGKFFNKEFTDKYKDEKNAPGVKWDIKESHKIKPVTINSGLEGEVFKIFVNAPNYSLDQIKYEFIGNNKIKVFGETQVRNNTGMKDISFSQEVFLPAPAKKDKIEFLNKDGKFTISVPLEIED